MAKAIEMDATAAPAIFFNLILPAPDFKTMIK
jgi:hypothetical protein